MSEVGAATAGSSVNPDPDSFPAQALSHTRFPHDTPAADEQQTAKPGQTAAQTLLTGIAGLHQQATASARHALPAAMTALGDTAPTMSTYSAG